MFNELVVISGSAHPEIAQKIADNLNVSLLEVEAGRFSDGEINLKILENIRGTDVFIVQPTMPPAENLMELLLMIDAVKRASGRRVTTVIPYFGYARQDRKDQPRVPIGAKLMANLITTAGADRVLTMDLHAPQIQGFFDIPLDHLYAAPVLLRYFEGRSSDNLMPWCRRTWVPSRWPGLSPSASTPAWPSSTSAVPAPTRPRS
jgi:ribose-phosphate pyrophosphokinase